MSTKVSKTVQLKIALNTKNGGVESNIFKKGEVSRTGLNCESLRHQKLRLELCQLELLWWINKSTMAQSMNLSFDFLASA